MAIECAICMHIDEELLQFLDASNDYHHICRDCIKGIDYAKANKTIKLLDERKGDYKNREVLIDEIKFLDELFDYLNKWADIHSHNEEAFRDNKRLPYGDGYKQCVRDVIKRIEERIESKKKELEK